MGKVEREARTEDTRADSTRRSLNNDDLRPLIFGHHKFGILQIKQPYTRPQIHINLHQVRNHSWALLLVVEVEKNETYEGAHHVNSHHKFFFIRFRIGQIINLVKNIGDSIEQAPDGRISASSLPKQLDFPFFYRIFLPTFIFILIFFLLFFLILRYTDSLS